MKLRPIRNFGLIKLIPFDVISIMKNGKNVSAPIKYEYEATVFV